MKLFQFNENHKKKTFSEIHSEKERKGNSKSDLGLAFKKSRINHQSIKSFELKVINIKVTDT